MDYGKISLTWAIGILTGDKLSFVIFFQEGCFKNITTTLLRNASAYLRSHNGEIYVYMKYMFFSWYRPKRAFLKVT